MGYEEAPLTQKMDTFCLCCSKPLVDAASLELGIGPICRKKLYNVVELNDESRKEINALLHKMSLDPSNEMVAKNIGRIEALGFTQLAKNIKKKFKLIEIGLIDGKFIIRSPYNQVLVLSARQNKGFFDPSDKSWRFATKQNAWNVLKAAYPKYWALGPAGPFQIP